MILLKFKKSIYTILTVKISLSKSTRRSIGTMTIMNIYKHLLNTSTKVMVLFSISYSMTHCLKLNLILNFHRNVMVKTGYCKYF